MSIQDVQYVGAFVQLLMEISGRVRSIKQTDGIGPLLNKSDIEPFFQRFGEIFPASSALETRKAIQFAVIETASRQILNNLLATTTINSPEFAAVWDLFDILSVLCDEGQCDWALLFWLVEELLDSQSIAGCRKVFDYLESRRARIATKHFDKKKLVILRSCNELLRRLSRAEDTAFCGRVFIFLFQSFPLGDRSSVNLRGVYNVENVTTFDIPESASHQMEVDSTSASIVAVSGDQNVEESATRTVEYTGTPTQGLAISTNNTPMTPNELYTIFWSMQQYFNQPRTLFDASNLSKFKHGLESTISFFKSMQTQSVARPMKATEEAKRGTKRKRSQGIDDLANSFNPKYLTSRDLFELEISDISFRRNILVQMLIIIDFLLSLSAKAKEKLDSSLPTNLNKSVLYADLNLNEEDTKWATDTKRSIADYLKQGAEGPFFYRVVETVLSRDKNWAYWKIENCPPIAKPSVTPEDFLGSKASAKKATTNKNLRPHPLGSLPLKFLAESETQDGLERLKEGSRYQVPPIKSFQNLIELDDMDIDMARDDESKNRATEAKASKTWRALRIASTDRFAEFDKIERFDKIDKIFEDRSKTEEPADAVEDDGHETRILEDRRPIVISGPSGVGKGALVTMLLEKHGKTFGKKASHTTRAPRDGEVHGQHYYFVTKDEYDVLRDGDLFLETNNFNGFEYGTSKKVLEGIVAQNKVPILEMDYHGIQQVKDNGYSARFIFLSPPNDFELETRLRKRGTDNEEEIQERLEISKTELEQSKVEGFHDLVLVNDDLLTTYKRLEDFIFGNEAQAAEAVGTEAGNSDAVPLAAVFTDAPTETELEPA